VLDKVLKETKQRMQKTVEAMTRELNTVRTGKASARLLDTVKVEVYGSTMPLNQLATITAAEARLLIIQVFDKATVGDIVKGIQKADLGLNPSVDGQIIRLAIPALNEERRKDLVRHCRQLVEEGRVAIRNIRRDANEQIKQSQQNKEVSEDQEADAHDEAQKLTNEHIETIDKLLSSKEKEVMEL